MKKFIDGKIYDITKDELDELKNIENELPIPIPTLEKMIEDVENINKIQDELINISLLATDEIFMMIEPLLSEVNTYKIGGNNKMVDMYVAMVQRGLKTIDEVPVRYREQVKNILEQLEK